MNYLKQNISKDDMRKDLDEILEVILKVEQNSTHNQFPLYFKYAKDNHVDCDQENCLICPELKLKKT